MRHYMLSFFTLLLVSHGAAGFPSACSRYVTAKVGDTCASIAISAGIDVTDFLRNNPSIKQCDVLNVGSRYCVESVALQVSPDGQCGGNSTCVGSAYGECCSEHGWCGSTADHCGAGCDAAHGVCSGSDSGSSAASQLPTSSEPPVTCPTGRATITETVRTIVTSTTLVRSTSTVLSTSVATSTGIVTSTVAIQRTVTVLFRTTSTILETSTITVPQTNIPQPELHTVTLTVTVVSIRTNPLPLPTTTTETKTIAAPASTITKTVISAVTYPCPITPNTVTRTVTVGDDDWLWDDGTWTGRWTGRRTRTRYRTWNGEPEEEIDVEISVGKRNEED